MADPTRPAEHGTYGCYRKGCRQDECVAANKERTRKYREANREKIRERDRNRREADPDSYREYNREYRAANRDKKRETDRKWYEANRNHRREYHRRYYAANRDKMRENARKWAEANPERARENARRYAEANADTARERVRKWNRDNPDRKRDLRRKIKHARRARERDAFVEHVRASEVFDRDDWTCHICGEPVNPELTYPDPMAATLDHIIPFAAGGEHSYENCSLAHFRCNLVKGAKVA